MIAIDPEAAARHVERLLQAQRPAADAAFVPPRSIGIVGAGMMGTAIAAAHVAAGRPVTITDLEPAALERCRGRIAEELQEQNIPGGAAAAIDRWATITGDLAAVAACELVLESIVEQLGPKLELFRRLDPLRAAGGILATNTSTIPLRKLAAALGRSADFCGLHFFHPVRRRPLVEVIRGPQSSPATLGRAMAAVWRLGRTPLMVGDGPGFLVNRLLQPWANEALRMLQEGHAAEDIDRAALDFGMAKGPLALLDEIGLDTALRGGLVLYEAFPHRIDASPVLLTLVKAGRLGTKSQAGIYGYSPAADGTLRRQPDPAVPPLLKRWALPPTELAARDWGLRLMIPMLVEAARILEEGLVPGPAEVDLGVLFGLGFPQRLGGLLYWADQLGGDRLGEILNRLAPLGPRMTPSDYLRVRWERRERFFG